MKLITLNSHSIVEPDYEKKLHVFSGVILKERPHVMALQEVSQTMETEPVEKAELEASGYLPCPVKDGMAGAVVRRDNHAYRLAVLLREGGYPMRWSWIPAKVGYDRYDEGLAVFSAWPVEAVDQFFLSGIRDYGNWKTRRVLGARICTPDGSQWFASVHLGWWQDEEEPFREQWARLRDGAEQAWAAGENAPVWLMGDCNSRADVRGEGYDLIRSSGWQDTYVLAEEKDAGHTVKGAIDGWKDGGAAPDMRIDYIWCSRKIPVKSSRTICSGIHEPVVSDHYGVMAEIPDGSMKKE